MSKYACQLMKFNRKMKIKIFFMKKNAGQMYLISLDSNVRTIGWNQKFTST